jgi:predicted homoserine dehydrogenase-like protein
MATSLDAASIKAQKPGNSSDVIRMGVVGYGYWGPNIVRNFHGQERSRVVAICDKSPKSQGRARQSYPEIRVTGECEDILTATDIDAIAIVTLHDGASGRTDRAGGSQESENNGGPYFLVYRCGEAH